MEQGQPGRPPLGDTLQATRHFLTDAVVFDDYTMHEGMVIPSGTIRTRYHPETCPELPQQLARVSRGDTAAALAFVRTYGLLGYAQVAAAVGHQAHSDAPGDPLSWIWAHAETVALCLLLTYGLQTGDDATLQHGLRAVHLPQPPHAEGGPRLIVPAVWDQPRVQVCWPSPLHTPEDWRTYARAIRREILNAHLLGVRPQLVDGGATDQPGCQFQALLAVVYWHLLQLATQGTVQRCAEVSCQAFFVPTRHTVRIPVIPATQSGAKLPLNPKEACHPIRTKAAPHRGTPSERSDAWVDRVTLRARRFSRAHAVYASNLLSE